MSNITSFRDLLSRGFAVVDADVATGERLNTGVVSRTAYLADYEIDRLVDALRLTVANQPQDAE